MDAQTTMERIRQGGGFVGLYQVTTYKGFREPMQGGVQPVTVEVWDGGPEYPEGRYLVLAWDAAEEAPGSAGWRRPGAGGTSAATLAEAIAGVHWADLDRGE